MEKGPSESWLDRLEQHEWTLVGLVMLAAFALGLDGARILHEAAGDTNFVWADYVYESFMLFILEASADGGSADYPVQLQVARFLAPAAVAWTAIRSAAVLLRSQLRELVLQRATDHVVVCGAGPVGRRLVEAFLHKGHSVVCIEPDPARLRTLRKLPDLHVVEGDPTDPASQSRARVLTARYLFGVMGDSDVNSRTAELARQISATRPSGKLECFLELGPESGVALRGEAGASARTDRFELQVFEPPRMAARRLVSKHPPYGDAPPSGADEPGVHALVVGFGEFAREVVRQIVRMGHFPDGRPVRVTVVDDERVREQGRFQLDHPGLPLVADVVFEPSDPLSLLPERWDDLQADGPFEVAYVTAETLAEGREIARRLVEGRMGSVGQPDRVVLCSEDVVPSFPAPPPTAYERFHTLDEVITIEAVVRLELDRLARAIHQAYLARVLTEGRAKPHDRPWEELSEDIRNANRDQADHVAVKLACLPVDGTPREKALAIAHDPDLVELFAAVEHRRWMASRVLDGFTWAAERNDTVRHHPDLIPYSELPDGTKEYDRDAARNLADLIFEDLDAR